MADLRLEKFVACGHLCAICGFDEVRGIKSQILARIVLEIPNIETIYDFHFT
jgi:hypothetical protein